MHTFIYTDTHTHRHAHTHTHTHIYTQGGKHVHTHTHTHTHISLKTGSDICQGQGDLQEHGKQPAAPEAEGPNSVFSVVPSDKTAYTPSVFCQSASPFFERLLLLENLAGIVTVLVYHTSTVVICCQRFFWLQGLRPAHGSDTVTMWSDGVIGASQLTADRGSDWGLWALWIMCTPSGSAVLYPPDHV